MDDDFYDVQQTSRPINYMEKVEGVRVSGPNNIELDDDGDELVKRWNAQAAEIRAEREEHERQRRAKLDAMDPAELADKLRRGF
ncbi:hypothetical protein [Glycomyces arizonensis]|uniref:hypothetical protein n=1 Tax=Glycomyces arizonensis TaxID=256035 RepID=UPI00047E998F|nr:hypothetical protein [Glycomyces arizonensis]